MRRRLVVVSNRGPATIDRGPGGERVIRRGAGGLVTALRPLLARHDVTWIASAMTDEERAAAAEGPFELELDHGRVRVVLVAHDPEVWELFYHCAANPLLWFVQHGLWSLKRGPDAEQGPAWEAYDRVNEAFAEATLRELDAGPAAVLFQDYHLYFAPRLVRERRPDALTAHVVHVPWVEPEGWLPLPAEVVRRMHEGLLANDVVSFHTRRWRDAFHGCAEAFLGAGATAATELRASPLAVDAGELEALAGDPAVRERLDALRRERPERLVLRVDRTDPAKNAVRGVEAFRLLLERRPDLRGRVRLLALLLPSRLDVPEYADHLAALERAAAAVNADLGGGGAPPVELRVRDDFPSSVAGYAEYDVLFVNPVLDGLNLVSKEAPLVNGRDGVLVLSHGAGAWEELGPWAIGVDPFDVPGQALALEQALELPAAQRRERLEGIRRHVRARGVDDWADGLLAALDRASTMRA